MKIVVSGLPGSGNHLVYSHLKRLEELAHDVEVPPVDHATHARLWQTSIEGADCVVIPYRLDETARVASCVRRKVKISDSVLRQSRDRLARTQLPRHVIVYEEMLRTDGEVLDDLIRSWGFLAPPAWPMDRRPAFPSQGRVMSREEVEQARAEVEAMGEDGVEDLLSARRAIRRMMEGST